MFAAVGTILDGLGRAFEMKLKPVAFADGIEPAPRWTEVEAENVAINAMAFPRSSASNCGAKEVMRGMPAMVCAESVRPLTSERV